MVNNIYHYMKETSREVSREGIIPYLEEYSHPDEIIRASNSHLPLLRAIKPKRKGRSGKDYAIQLLSNIGRSIFENLNTSDLEWQKIIPYLASIELLLTSTYLIDDIDDNQKERFGDEATWIKFGLSEAMFAACRQREIAERIIIDKQECSPETKVQLLGILSDINRKTYDGQTLNERLKERYDHEIYLERCKYFGGVLGGYVGIGAAILAGANKEQVDLVNNLVINYGTAGMIRNDLKDFMTSKLICFDHGISKALNRIPLEDIRIGRITYPLHVALSDSRYGERLRQFLGKHELSEDEEKEIVFMVAESGGFDKTIDLIEEYKQKALSYCEQLPENESKYILIDLINLMKNSIRYSELMKNENQNG